MELIIGEHAGFCYGVSRAVKKAFECAEKRMPCVTLGPLMHNPQEVERLRQAGIGSVASVAEVKDGQTLIIRSHGVVPEAFEEAERRGIPVMDMTCPHVSAIHDMVKKYSINGDTVIIVGAAEHPEVKGIAGWAGGPVIILEDAESAKTEPLPDRAMVVAQTTMRQKQFEEVIAVLKTRIPELEIRHTICAATGKRQEEAERLSRNADVMIVVGGKNSSNTQKLYETCSARCRRAYLVETPEDVLPEMFMGSEHVAVTAGASTPEWLLSQVVEKIRKITQII